MKLTSKLLPILVLALLAAVPGFAQTGNLTGKVVDTDGKPMNGVTLSLERQGTSQPSASPGTQRGTGSSAPLHIGEWTY